MEVTFEICMRKTPTLKSLLGNRFQKPNRLNGSVSSKMDDNPQRRLMNVLAEQGMQANQQITFLSDGADNVGTCNTECIQNQSMCWIGFI